jgi:hypothetical protein
MSNCPHCNHSTFEIEEINIAEMRLRVVQCSGCKAPIGILGTNDIDQRIAGLEQRMMEFLRILVSSLQKIGSRLDQIERNKMND